MFFVSIADFGIFIFTQSNYQLVTLHHALIENPAEFIPIMQMN